MRVKFKRLISLCLSLILAFSLIPSTGLQKVEASTASSSSSMVSGGGPAQVCIGGYGFRLYLVPITSNQSLLDRTDEGKSITDDYFFVANYNDDTDDIGNYTLRRNISNSSYATNRVLDKYAHLTGLYYYTDYVGGDKNISTVVAANSNFGDSNYKSLVQSDRFKFDTSTDTIANLLGNSLIASAKVKDKDGKEIQLGSTEARANFLDDTNRESLSFNNLKSAFNNIDNYYFANQENFNELLDWFINHGVENIKKSGNKYKFIDEAESDGLIDKNMCYRDYYLVVEPVSYWYKSGQTNNLVAITWQNVIYQNYHDTSYDNLDYLKNNFFPQNKYNYKRDDTNAERGYQRGCSGIWQSTFKGDGEAKGSNGEPNANGYGVLDFNGNPSNSGELTTGRDSAGFFILGGSQEAVAENPLDTLACNVSVWYNYNLAKEEKKDNAEKSVFDYGSRTNLVNSEAVSKQLEKVADGTIENKEFSDSSLYTSSNKFKTPSAMERTLGLSDSRGDVLNSHYKMISIATGSLKLDCNDTSVSKLEEYLSKFETNRLGATWSVTDEQSNIGCSYDFDSVYLKKSDGSTYISDKDKTDSEDVVDNYSPAKVFAKGINNSINNLLGQAQASKLAVKTESSKSVKVKDLDDLINKSSPVDSGNLVFGKAVQAIGNDDDGNVNIKSKDGETASSDLDTVKKSGSAKKSTVKMKKEIPVSFSMYARYPDITTNIIRLKSSYDSGKYTCEAEKYNRFGDTFVVSGTKTIDDSVVKNDDGEAREYKYSSIYYPVDENSDSLKFNEEDIYVVVVKKGMISNLNDTIDALTIALNGKKPDEIVATFKDYFEKKESPKDSKKTIDIEMSKSTKEQTSITVGAYKEDVTYNGNTITIDSLSNSIEAKDAWYKNTSFDGYDIFILSYEGDIKSEANVELADYELNKVIPNVTNTAYSVMKNKVIDNNKVIAYVRPDLISSVTITDGSTGASIINSKKVYNYSNNTKLFGKSIESVFSNYDKFNFPGTHPRRSSFDSNIYALTYSGIFSRSSFGDNKVISTISQDINDDALKSANDILNLTAGVSPTNNNLQAGERNSSAYIQDGNKDKVLSDEFKFTSGDKLGLTFNYGNNDKYSVIYTKNFISKINQKAHIYNTVAIDSLITADKVSKVDTSDFATKDGLGIKGNMITKQHSGIKLYYYPEVPMIYHTPKNMVDNKFAEYNTGIIKVMGDVKRSSNARSLYFFSTQSDTANYTGTIFSDGMISNSKNDKPTIYAGSDITLKVDDKDSDDTDINIYGYSVDLINNNESLTYVDSSNNSVTVDYKNIIKSGANIYEKWGNGADKDTSKGLYTDFSNFANLFKNKNNYNLGIKLEVSGGNNATKNYNNFAGTIGKVESGSGAKAEYVYPIGIKNGEVVKDDRTVYGQGYKHLCEQIEADYHAKAGQGATILENAGILQGVIDSIESSDKDYNNSQPYDGNCKLGSSNKKADGSLEGKWYDEEVNTIVIRRYKCEGIKVSGITVQDKIDIDTVSNGDKPAQGKWYLDLSLKKNALKDWGITDEFELTTNSLINNTEFLIPSKTTQDMN